MSEISPNRVVLLGLALVGTGAAGFYSIPGMIAENAEGSKLVNAIYCSVITLTTIGFGDICPGDITGPGRTFIVLLAFSGLGMFCGPIMDLTASWKDSTADKMALLTLTIVTSVFVFSYLLEEMTESEAAYFSIITGTTIGYGDISPKSDAGKLAVALYAILAVNVVASLLEPAKDYLQSFCLVPAAKTPKKVTTSKKQVTNKKNKPQSPSKVKASQEEKLTTTKSHKADSADKEVQSSVVDKKVVDKKEQKQDDTTTATTGKTNGTKEKDSDKNLEEEEKESKKDK